MKDKNCGNCLHFILLYRRRGAFFSKSLFGQCNRKNPNKYEMLKEDSNCEKWEDIQNSFEAKKQSVETILKDVSEKIAAIEVLLSEINRL